MSTSIVAMALEPGDPAGSLSRSLLTEGTGSMTLLTNPKELSSSLARERNRRDATPREADASLMAALLRKEPAAADALYARYAPRIYGLGLVLLKNKADAEDLVQDTFLKVWRTGSAFNPRRGSLDVWILLTARSLAIDLLRRRTLETRKLSSGLSGSDVSDEQGPEWYAEQRDLIRRVRRAIDLPPPRQRSAVALAYLGQRSSTQLAELQGIPPGTVKSRIRAGIATLRQTLAEGSSDRPRPTCPNRPERFSDRKEGNREAHPHREAEGSPGAFLG